MASIVGEPLADGKKQTEAGEEISAPHSGPRIGFVSLGCPKNLVDSEVMMGMLDRAGAVITSRPEDADILVVNTCAFIDRAKQESVDAILDLARLKSQGRARKLIVAGCLVERYGSEIRTEIPEVDALVGTGELEQILAAAGLKPRTPAPAGPFTILNNHHEPAERPEAGRRVKQGRFARNEWAGARPDLPQYLYDHATPRILSTGRASAYIKIAEGCDHPCSFCIIPNLRGKFRSRQFESVVAEAERLVAGGVREITLVGQDTTCYGEDLGMHDGLAQLLHRLAAIPRLRWLRFLYAYPNKITGRLLDTIAAHENICRYMDVPLQHAAGPVLKRMRRGGNADIFLELIGRMRSTIPDIALRTSLIAGFPGETEEDFETTAAFIQEARFDWLGVFSYSDEEGAGAYDLDRKVSAKTIERRRRELMRIQNTISRKSKRAQVGQSFDLLVEGESEETPLLWEGRTEFHAPAIDGKVYINDFGPFENLTPGRFYHSEVTEAHDYDLVARITGEVDA